MSLARSRPIEPSRAMTAHRRVIHRNRRGRSRTASSSACSASAARRVAGRDGIPVGRGVPKPFDRGVDRGRVHHPCRRGQLVLVVAAVSVVSEERLDRLPPERCPAFARRSPRAPGRTCAVSAGSSATSRPSVHSRCASCAESTSPSAADDAVRQSGGHAGAVENLVEQPPRRTGEHAELQQPLHARCLARSGTCRATRSAPHLSRSSGRAATPATSCASVRAASSAARSGLRIS